MDFLETVHIPRPHELPSRPVYPSKLSTVAPTGLKPGVEMIQSNLIVTLVLDLEHHLDFSLLLAKRSGAGEKSKSRMINQKYPT